MTQSYDQQDVQQILQLAIARQDRGETLTREHLLEMADELGISPESLLAAEKDWLTKQSEFQQKQDFDLYRRRKFQKNTERFLIVNTFLVLLNLVNSHALSWSLYIILGWGLGLALNAWKIYKIDQEDYEKAFQVWRRKQQLGQSINTVLDKFLKP